MSDRPTSGPAPQWGEYAPVPEKPDTPAAPERAVVAPADDAAPGPTGAPSTGPRRERAWDRALTIGLLAFGGLNLLWSIPQFVDFADVLRTAYSTAGYGAYTSDALAGVLGNAAIAVQVVILIAAVLLAGRNLRRGRISFWIPLVAGVVALVLVTAILIAAMVGDPALSTWIDREMTTPTSTP